MSSSRRQWPPLLLKTELEPLCGEPRANPWGAMPDNLDAKRTFIMNSLMQHDHVAFWCNLDKLFVLYGYPDNEEDGELKWTQILPAYLREEMRRDSCVVLGFMMVNRDSHVPGIGHIDWIETRLRGRNVGLLMISKFQERYHCTLQPRVVGPETVEYWRKSGYVIDLVSDD